MTEKVCNLCGSTAWGDMNSRAGVRCLGCNSVERTRAMKLVLDHLGMPRPDARILHFAPDKGLSRHLENCAFYDPVDFDPKWYPHTHTRQFDMLKDMETLETNSYDLIIHSHVLEHIPCNIAPLLHHMYRALKPDGWHVFCIPIIDSYYDECFRPLGREVANKRFGQFDHVRLFGAKDMDRHIGSLVRLDCDYTLYKYASLETIEKANIPLFDRQGLQGSTIFATRKSDYKLA